ncbi:uncharacterized protein ARMOST_06553 [Armillaria ostoyae]|uniref:Uncharacterized protein n=1 Tax=Armillaria ostoyae TaxID=47428 RepID=A0A284R3E4_ARMOS|nr:uncharacterized protein ARMOST_06553 [Armillaria ostoyae]
MGEYTALKARHTLQGRIRAYTAAAIVLSENRAPMVFPSAWCSQSLVWPVITLISWMFSCTSVASPAGGEYESSSTFLAITILDTDSPLSESALIKERMTDRGTEIGYNIVKI